MPPTDWSNPHSIATTQVDNNLTDVALLQRYMSEVQYEVSRFDVKCDEILTGALRPTPVATPARGRGEGRGLGQDTPSDSETEDHLVLTRRRVPGQEQPNYPSSDTTAEIPPSPAHPRTPVAPTTLLIPEISPTDSNFSIPSIFDSPLKTAPSSSVSSCSSPCSTAELATCDAQPQSPSQSQEQSLSPSPSEDQDQSQDYEPDDHLPIPPLNPSAPHLIILTSCLPCVLASLPCSRTLPSCSRCLRNNRLCLPQRKRVWQEIRNDGWKTEPMLVRREDEGEEEWGGKVGAMGELLEEWRVKHERSFWAPVEGRLAWGAGHPGDGKGQMVVRQMRIGSWHRGALEEAERVGKGGK